MKKVFMRSAHAKRSMAALLCLALLFLLTTQSALAADGAEEDVLDPVAGNGDYSAVVYNNTNGLPTSEANDIVQTSEGFIWIGSYSGLTRYDGNTFERRDPSLSVGSVVCLYVDREDRLWIGTNENGLAMLEGGVRRIWEMKDGLGSNKIQTITEDEKGTIYVGTTSGITMIEPDLSLHAVEDPRVAYAFINQIQPGPDGLQYCLTNDGDYFTMRDGELVDYIDRTHTTAQGITCLLPDPETPGSVYFGTEESVCYHGDLKKGAASLSCTDISPLACVNEIKLLGGGLWICAQNGIGVERDRASCSAV